MKESQIERIFAWLWPARSDHREPPLRNIPPRAMTPRKSFARNVEAVGAGTGLFANL